MKINKWIIFCKKKYKNELIERIKFILLNSGIMKRIKPIDKRQKNCECIFNFLCTGLFHLYSNFSSSKYSIEMQQINIGIGEKTKSFLYHIPVKKELLEIEQIISGNKKKIKANAKPIQNLFFHIQYNLSLEKEKAKRNFDLDMFSMKMILDSFFSYYAADINRVNLTVCIQIIYNDFDSLSQKDMKNKTKRKNLHKSNFKKNDIESEIYRLFVEYMDWKNFIKIETIGLTKITTVFSNIKEKSFNNILENNIIYS